MPNIRDNLGLYLLTALVAIVCIASVGQVVGSDTTPIAGTDATKSVPANGHRAKPQVAQIRDAY